MQRLLAGTFISIALILFLRVYFTAFPHKKLQIARISVLSALAIVFGMIESFIPDIIIPGVKIGLPNIVVLYLLCYGKKREALLTSLLRVVAVGLLRGNLFQMGGLMSLGGALLSFTVMTGIKLIYRKSSPIFLSILGALSHGVGQLLVGVVFLGTWGIFYYYPLMGLLSIVMGAVSGTLTILVGKRIR